MKKILSAMFVCLSISLSAQTVKGVVNEGLRYCESTYPYQGGILVANFGTAELNPLNTEGKGYIAFYKDGKTQVMVPADGNLSAPKGMFIRQDYLYVCDVNKIVVYHLTDKAEAADGNYLYASVTNTDRIFRLDISNPAQPGQPEEWLQISGPNGLLVRDGMMYVASYPADGVTKEANVIYRIDNLKQPVARKLTEVTGQYDGIAFASDGKSLIVTNWTPAQLSRIDLASGKMSPLPLKLEQPLIGPADITVKDGFIYIPDLPNSRVVVVKESCCCKSNESHCPVL